MIGGLTSVPRFSMYSKLLDDFATWKQFHKKYPVNRTFEGIPPSNLRVLPPFAQESLERLINEILHPLYTFKKHTSLMGTNQALQLPFVSQVTCILLFPSGLAATELKKTSATQDESTWRGGKSVWVGQMGRLGGRGGWAGWPTQLNSWRKTETFGWRSGVTFLFTSNLHRHRVQNVFGPKRFRTFST